MFSQIKDIKHIAYWPEFSLCDLDNATGVGDRVLAGSKHERGDLRLRVLVASTL